jgi:hypothetical protein
MLRVGSGEAGYVSEVKVPIPSSNSLAHFIIENTANQMLRSESTF